MTSQVSGFRNSGRILTTKYLCKLEMVKKLKIEIYLIKVDSMIFFLFDYYTPI